MKQTFFDDIAELDISLNLLSFVVGHWEQFTDFSVLSKLTVSYFELYFQQFHRAAIWALMRNPACNTFEFNFYEHLWEDDQFGELRKKPSTIPRFSHLIRRVKREFRCQPCGWISIYDSKRSLGPLEATLQHVEKPRNRPNMTLEEMRRPELCLRDNLGESS